MRVQEETKRSFAALANVAMTGSSAGGVVGPEICGSSVVLAYSGPWRPFELKDDECSVKIIQYCRTGASSNAGYRPVRVPPSLHADIGVLHEGAVGQEARQKRIA